MFLPFPAEDLAHMIVNVLLPASLPPPLQDGEKQNTLITDKADNLLTHPGHNINVISWNTVRPRTPMGPNGKIGDSCAVLAPRHLMLDIATQ